MILIFRANCNVARQPCRILRSDLEAFIGHPLPPAESELAKRQRHVEVSAVVQIDAISPELAAQLESSLVAFVHGQSGGSGERVLSEAIYDRNIGRLKIILLGDTKGTGAALKFITALLEAHSSEPGLAGSTIATAGSR